ncbi:MAG: DAK2 domain-containing protein, partial [Acidimicrobiales bacterium]
VLRPAEGTILTVAVRAAEAARAAVTSRSELVETLEATRAAAVEALWKTPTQLDVLAEAGVVDAGGAGLVLLYDALLHATDGRAMPEALELPEPVAALVATGAPLSVRPALGDAATSDLDGSTSPRYEVMYLLSAKDALIPAFKDVWAGIGDSIVVVGGDGLWNCHIHTDEIGAAIEAGLDAGRPRDIRVTDLAGQVEEERWVREAARGVTEVPPKSEAGAKSSVVVVANGEGIERIFHSLGVRHFVEGGQSMNPSTRELLEAIESSPADEVVVLPNNANIIPVACQAAEVSKKKVRVVPTEGIQEGFAALLEYDPGASGDENAEAMGRAARRVVAGEMTRAVRATTSSVGDVHVGDFIGLSRGGIESVAETLADATIGLLRALLRPEHEIVTILQGDGAAPGDTRRVTEWLAEEHPDVSVELHHGGQPLYPYLVSIE